MAVTRMDRRIATLALKADHRTLAIWAADCAGRVLPYFERKRPEDVRPRKAIAACRKWVRTGIFHMADIRGASLSAHSAAREVIGDDAARSAARSAGQAVATAHVPAHSIAAAIYAATAAKYAANPENADAAALNEREWQYRRLVRLMKK